MHLSFLFFFFFFFNDTATTEIYTLSLHDALPISSPGATWRVRRSESRTAIRRRRCRTASARRSPTRSCGRSGPRGGGSRGHRRRAARWRIRRGSARPPRTAPTRRGRGRDRARTSTRGPDRPAAVALDGSLVDARPRVAAFVTPPRPRPAAQPFPDPRTARSLDERGVT